MFGHQLWCADYLKGEVGCSHPTPSWPSVSQTLEFSCTLSMPQFLRPGKWILKVALELWIESTRTWWSQSFPFSLWPLLHFGHNLPIIGPHILMRYSVSHHWPVLDKLSPQGLPWWSNDWDFVLPMHGAWIHGQGTRGFPNGASGKGPPLPMQEM